MGRRSSLGALAACCALIAACSSPSVSRPATVLVVDAPKPPTGLAILVSAPSPHRDLTTLSMLIPQTPSRGSLMRLRELVLSGLAEARRELGEGISDAVDERGPL